ncbi:MAG: metal ABC transporter substrate-binding protein, partial [Oscillospiraceae bacterium]|nr:metal ABC transporter substrate-binding protein [Oscillospiraceae bacterium]
MKRILKICLYTIALAVAVFMVGCKGNDLPVDDGKLKIVTTIFPEYDWVKQIAGDSNNLDITFLMKNGGDLHSYSPSAEDILKISSCDMLVYVGGESDKWIEEILENSVNSNIKTINLMNVLGEKAKEEELVEGMEDDDHDDHGDHDDDDAELEYDEHVWLSLDNAQLFVKSITENLCAI